jgi:hypothetical protein
MMQRVEFWRIEKSIALLLAGLCCVLLCGAHDTHSQAKEANSGFLFNSAQTSFTIPFDIHIGLVGMNGNGEEKVELLPDTLREILQNSLPAGVPSCAECQKAIPVDFIFKYNVFHVSDDTSKAVHRIISKGLHISGSKIKHSGDAVNQFPQADHVMLDIDIKDIEDPLEELLDKELEEQHAQFVSAQDKKLNRDLLQAKPYSIWILNPSKATLFKHLKDDIDKAARDSSYIEKQIKDLKSAIEFTYRYRYGSGNKQGTPTKSWVGKSRKLFVDLTARSSEYGVTNAGEGTIDNMTMICQNHFCARSN